MKRVVVLEKMRERVEGWDEDLGLGGAVNLGLERDASLLLTHVHLYRVDGASIMYL